MNDKEIKDLLRELSEKAEKSGQIKSKTISITLNDTPKKKKKRLRTEEPSPEEAAAPREEPGDADAVPEESEAPVRQRRRKESPAGEEPRSPRGRRRFRELLNAEEGPEKEKAPKKIRYEDKEPDFESDADDFRTPVEEPVQEKKQEKPLFGALLERLDGLKERRAEHAKKAPDDPEAAAEAAGQPAPETAEDDLEEGLPKEELSGESGGDDWFAKLVGGEELPQEGEEQPKEETESAAAADGEEAFEEPSEDAGTDDDSRDPLSGSERVETSEAEEETPLPEGEHESASRPEQSGEIPVDEDKPVKVKKVRKPVKLPEAVSAKLIAALAGAAVLLAVIIFALVHGIGGSKKSENVTADPGLTLTVESEPSKWTCSGKVTLGIRTPSPIQTITVNGENVDFTGKNKTKVTVQTSDHLLDVMVVSEDNVLKGQATIPMIDGTAPELEIAVSGGTASMSATDDFSGVDKIYYGVLKGLTTVPVYTEYTAPFKPEEQTIYYCTAKDTAGNFSKPVITDLTQAQSISLDAEKMTMFPGETRQLQINPAPAGSFLSGLRIVNTDSSVISIDENGMITALAEGTSLLTISAEGVETVNCAVTVRTEAAVTISFTGDCTLGDDETFSTENNLSSFYDAYGPEYFFANVKDIFADDDYTFVNLESPLTDQGERYQKEYAFRGRPEFVNILTDGNVDGVTLANNHSADYGDISLTDTEKYLDEAGIDYALERDYILKEINGVQVAFIGVHALFDGMTCIDRVEETINDARAAGAEIVIVAFHWGDELSTIPAEVQTQLGHTAIDLGADLVVGHHPHVLQGIEIYKDKYIVYSLANFCFGGNTNPRELDTMIFQMTFLLSEQGDLTDTQINIIPCSSSSVEGWNNYQPTPAEGEEAKRIIDKINERSEPFGFTYEYKQ